MPPKWRKSSSAAGRNVPNGRLEHIVRIIRPLEFTQASVVGAEGQRDSLLLAHVQQIDVATWQRVGCQGAGGVLCPLHMPLVRFRRRWLPARDDFDHQMFLPRRKGGLGGGNAACCSMKVMDREGRKRRRELLR